MSEKITVNIVFNRNPYIKIDLEPIMLIKDVKTLIFSKLPPKMNTKNIKLYKNSKELDENLTLVNYNIGSNSKIELIIMQNS
jgi:hypothetical protein